ncbi:MAG: NAD(P)H-dependent oxidoreductase subunit E [Chitinispirillaceae bacterium]|nr:NAD(P)H-dependent oxidoreductase subunit E [Chitinispirillaceae bacterium]
MKSTALEIATRCTNDYSAIDSFINFLDIKTGVLTRKSDLITILHQAQRIYGYLPLDVQEHIAEKLDLDLNDITSIIHFYSFFNTEPQPQRYTTFTSVVFS